MTQIEELRQQVTSFYSFTTDPQLALGPQSPCTFTEGALVAKPKWSVVTPGPLDHAHSTCPWRQSVDEDVTGGRFPCRIATAELVGATSGRQTPCVGRVNPTHRRYGRHQGKLCEALVQQVPVLQRELSEISGSFEYSVKNINITVGFTCAFENRFF